MWGLVFPLDPEAQSREASLVSVSGKGQRGAPRRSLAPWPRVMTEPGLMGRRDSPGPRYPGPRSPHTAEGSETPQEAPGALGACGGRRAGVWAVAPSWGQSAPPTGLAPLSAANPGGILVMKSCAPTCPNSTVSADGRTLSVSCCQGSQCNRSAAAGLAGGRAALWVGAAAGLLWLLLWAAC